MADPFTLLKPSTKSVHLDVEYSVRLSNSLSACTRVLEVKFAMKSANICDLSAMRGWKAMSYSLSSIAYLVSRPKSSGLCRMLFNGYVVSTMIGWH